MLAYLLRRILYAIPILIGVNLLTFALFFVVNTPDDMARMQLGIKRVTPDAIEKWKQQHGYDKPLLLNSTASGTDKITDTIFWQKSASMFALDFGYSDDGRNISREISTRMWPSLAIALPSFLIGLAVYVSFALLMTLFRATALDIAGVALCVLLMSVSGLFYIIGGQFVVSKLWHLVPISGYVAGMDSFKFVAVADIHRRDRQRRFQQPLVSHHLPRRDRQGLCAHRARQGLVGIGGAVPPCVEERDDPYPHRRGGGHPAAVHGQPVDRVVLRHTRSGQLHHRCDQCPGFQRGARDGIPRFAAVYRRADPHRHFLHDRGPAGETLMSFMPVILWSDVLVFLLLAAGIACAWYVRQREHLLLPWRRVAQSATAMVSLLVLSLFLLVGLLDTLHYRIALPEKNNGDTVYSPEVLSVFDKLVTPLRTHTEKTYSAPLAVTLYAKESISDAQGKVLREYPRLLYGGAHLTNMQRRDADVFWRGLTGALAGLAVGLLIALGGKRLLAQRGWPLRALLIAILIISALIGMTLNLAAEYHVLGTDKVGQDVLYLSLKSIRTGLIIGTVTTLVTIAAGLVSWHCGRISARLGG